MESETKSLLAAPTKCKEQPKTVVVSFGFAGIIRGLFVVVEGEINVEPDDIESSPVSEANHWSLGPEAKCDQRDIRSYASRLRFFDSKLRQNL